MWREVSGSEEGCLKGVVDQGRLWCKTSREGGTVMITRKMREIADIDWD